MTDDTPEDVGMAICRIHELVIGQANLERGDPKKMDTETWSRMLEALGWIMSKWMMHPLYRNWSLIGDLESFEREWFT